MGMTDRWRGEEQGSEGRAVTAAGTTLREGEVKSRQRGEVNREPEKVREKNYDRETSQ